MKISFLIFTLLISHLAIADAVKGKQLYVTRGCTACHGGSGRSLNKAVYPDLTGKPKAQLIKSFRAYQTGKKVNPLMSSMAKTIQPNQVADLFDYIATFK